MCIQEAKGYQSIRKELRATYFTIASILVVIFVTAAIGVDKQDIRAWSLSKGVFFQVPIGIYVECEII